MKKVFIVMMMFILTTCASNSNQIVDTNDDPQESEQVNHPDIGKRIAFNKDVETTKIIQHINLEVLLNRSGQENIYLDDYKNPSFYFVSHEKIFFNGAAIEGSAIYNSETDKLNLNFTIVVGSSTGAMDGDHVDYVLDLVDKSISDLKIAEWTGKRNIDIFAKDVSEGEFIDFGFSIYSTIKDKYEDWDIGSEDF